MTFLLLVFIIIFILLLSATLHEAMHAFASQWLGDDTAKLSGRLTLNPLAHIDPFLTIVLPLLLFIVGAPIFAGAKPVPYNPYRLKYGDWGQALVGVAGPLTNLMLAIVAGVWIRFIDMPDNLSLLVQLFVQINLGLFIFNMLPIPPLDGSRLLYAISPESLKRTLREVERMSLFIIFAVVLLFQGTVGKIIGSIMQPLFETITGQSFTQFLISLSNLLQ